MDAAFLMLSTILFNKKSMCSTGKALVLKTKSKYIIRKNVKMTLEKPLFGTSRLGL